MLKLPTEVRLRIFEYLLPSESLGFLPPEIYGDSDEYSDIGESLGCDLDDWNMSLLLVNRQIYQEASSTLYGKAVFQVDIDDESLSVPGSRFMVGPVSPNNNPHGQGWKAQLEILPYRKIKVFHVEITAPAMLDGPHRISTPNWEKLLHDVHDNVHRLASLFKEVNRIRNLSVAVSFVTHSPLIESVVAPAKWLLEPLWALRNVQRLDIKDIQLHVEPDRTTRKMILIGTKSAGADNVSLQASRMEWSAHVKEKEALFPSTDVAPSVPPKILEMYKRIDDAAVALRDVVPYGGEWGVNRCEHLNQLREILHLARVARENENLDELLRIGTKLPKLWQRVLRQQEERRAHVDAKVSCLESKETTSLTAAEHFRSKLQVNN